MSLNLDSIQGLVTTTNATPTTVATYDFDANSLTNVSAIAKIRVVGADSSQNTICIDAEYAVKRETGNCSLVGLVSVQLANKDLALALASASLVVNGAAVDLMVTGVFATTINWGGKIEVLYLTEPD